MKKLYELDFETTTDENDCRVWAWAGCPIEESITEYVYGNSLEGFMEWIKRHCGSTIYFHNLKFDGEFIISWLFKNGFKHNTNSKKLKAKEFSTLISDRGQFYSMTICFDVVNGKKRQVVINDSLKILPFSVAEIAKAFDLPIRKLELDYKTYRPVGHKLKDHEIEYIKGDVSIVAQALHILFSQGLNKITQGSNALSDYKYILGKKKFEKWFPVLDYDADIRQAYKGGFTYLNKRYANKDVGEGIVLDVNSLYPYVMYEKLLPYGEGKFFTGKYVDDKEFPLYVQKICASFKLKENYIPTIQLKNNLSFVPTQYLESSEDQEVEMVLTNVDLKLFLEHYDIIDIEYINGWKFRGAHNMFKPYIDKWIKVKNEATISGNKAMRTLAKLMLNALYGKFGLNPNVCSKIPYLSEEGVVKYTLGEKETRDPIYIPMAVFITAYARDITIRSAQQNYDRFIYADTDSLHLEGLEEPCELEIDEVKLGAWKHESTFHRGRYIRSKTYIEDEYKNTFYMPDTGLYGSTSLKITCAGLPKTAYKEVTWDNFKPGVEYGNKLTMKHVKNGIILKETTFKISA